MAEFLSPELLFDDNNKYSKKFIVEIELISAEYAVEGLQDNSPRDNLLADNSPKNLNFFLNTNLT